MNSDTQMVNENIKRVSKTCGKPKKKRMFTLKCHSRFLCVMKLCIEPVFNHCTVELLYCGVSEKHMWTVSGRNGSDPYMRKSTLHPGGRAFKYISIIVNHLIKTQHVIYTENNTSLMIKMIHIIL